VRTHKYIYDFGLTIPPIFDSQSRRRRAHTMANVYQSELRSQVLKELCKQLEPCIPIKSFSEVVETLGEVTVGSQRIPLKLLAAHVSDDTFPIEDAKDLERAVNEGIERAIALSGDPSFPLRNQVFDKVMGKLTQREARAGLKLPAIYRTYFPEPTR
jgi:hypothetical protein